MLIQPSGHSRNQQLRLLRWSAKPGSAVSCPEQKKQAGQAKLGALPSDSPLGCSAPKNKTQNRAFLTLHQHGENHDANPTRPNTNTSQVTN